uniref:LRRNT domain-containing protein n=1 Tax=Amphiprion percula TaxID=161767 RepID=A0A3P8TJG8_AMPPE
MKGLLLLFLLLLSGSQRSSACPHLCSCHGGQVDCSSRSLASSSLPTSFPAGTTDLRLHNNLLSTLPNGLLDGLTSLRSVSLHDSRGMGRTKIPGNQVFILFIGAAPHNSGH